MAHCVKHSDHLGRKSGKGGGTALRVVQEAFDAGCAEFLDAGFSFGDPFDYLHEPGHPHLKKPEFRTCQSCTPPVHGQVMMLHSGDDGAAVETLGSATCVAVPPGTERWRSLKRSSCRAANIALAALWGGAATDEGL